MRLLGVVRSATSSHTRQAGAFLAVLAALAGVGWGECRCQRRRPGDLDDAVDARLADLDLARELRERQASGVQLHVRHSQGISSASWQKEMRPVDHANWYDLSPVPILVRIGAPVIARLKQRLAIF